MKTIDPEIVREVQDLADQRAIDFFQKQSAGLTAVRMQRYSENNSVLEFFAATRSRYNALAEALVQLPADQVEMICDDVQGRLDEAETYWNQLYVEPVAVKRSGGSVGGERLFRTLQSYSVAATVQSSPREEVEGVAQKMTELIRGGMPLREPGSIHGFRAYRDQQHLEDLGSAAHLEENALQLEDMEDLIRDNLSRVLVALETVAEYHSRLSTDA